MKLMVVAFAAFLAIASAAAKVEVPNADVSVTSLERTLDMSSQLVKSSVKATLVNGGAKPVKTLHWAVDPTYAGHVTHIAASVRRTAFVFGRFGLQFNEREFC